MTARSVYLPKGLELRRDRRFREVDLGRWEDIPFGWLERFEPERMTQFNKEPQLWSVKDSETFPEYTQRFLTALREAAEENDGKRSPYLRTAAYCAVCSICWAETNGRPTATTRRSRCSTMKMARFKSNTSTTARI